MRRFTVVGIDGSREIGTYGDRGPLFLEVVVRLRNAKDEMFEMRLPIDDQPKVGDVFEMADLVLLPPRQTPE